MPRALRSSTLQTRTSRAKLAQRPKPYWFSVTPGISLGYRRNKGAGSWSVRRAEGDGTNWIDKLALADDRENSNGKTVLTFSEACDRAKAYVRGPADAGKPATVDEALAAYADDLAVRGGGAGNARHPRHHLTAALLAMRVSLLTVNDLKRWRDGLAAKGVKASTINRMCKGLKRALNLAREGDERITSNRAWTLGLKALPKKKGDTTERRPLKDEQVRDVVSAAYGISPEFGLYVEVHTLGVRSSQLAMLDVGDLQLGAKPRLHVPSSLKGKDRAERTRTWMTIPAGLAQRLKQAAAGRADDQPLLRTQDGHRWSALAHRRPFIAAAKAAGLPEGTTIYALRHSAISKALVEGVPIRLVAAKLDTSVRMIEDAYSRFLADLDSEDQMQRTQFDLDAPADGGNVVAMKRR